MTALTGIQSRVFFFGLAIVAALLVFSGRDAPQAEASHSFNLNIGFSYCPIDFNPSTDVFDTSPTGCNYATDASGDGTSYDSTTKFQLGAPDANFASTVTFTPVAGDLTGGGNIAGGGSGSIDVGAIVGELRSSTRLGLLNSECAQPVSGGVRFTLMNASLDNSSGNIVSPKPAGQSNRMLPLRQDDATSPHTGNIAGIPDGVDGYPDFINALTDPDFINAGVDGEFGTADDIDGPLAPILPHARYVGTTDVSGTAISIQFLTFKPGDLTAFNAWAPYAASLSVAGSLTGATVAGTTTLEDTTAGKFDGEPLVGRTIQIGAGPGTADGESQVILSQNAATQTIEVANFTGTPATGDDYTIGGIPSNPHPLSQFASYYGWASVTVLSPPHPFDLKGSPSAISDFCTPLSVGTVLLGSSFDNACTPSSNVGGGDCPLKAGCDGNPTIEGICPEIPALPTTLGGAFAGGTTIDEGGTVRVVGPAANTGMMGTNSHPYVAFGISQRDADGDGIENGLDPCPLDDNSSSAGSDFWDPRVSAFQAPNTTSDPDTNGIPSPCDTVAGGGNDGDSDGFDNRQDNCPNIANGTGSDFNADSESLLGLPADGGPRGDSIGDACDPDDLTSDGAYKVALVTSAICIDDDLFDADSSDSTPATNPAPSLDGDARSTYCTDTLALFGASSPIEHLGAHYGLALHEGASLAETPYTQPCNDEVDTDGDDGTNFDVSAGTGEGDGTDAGSEPDCDGTGDIDGDGFSDALELLHGTDPRKGCSVTAFHDTWLPDTFQGSFQVADGQDLVIFLPALFKGVGQGGYTIRLDLFQPGTVIDGQDLVFMLPFLFQGCPAP